MDALQAAGDVPPALTATSAPIHAASEALIITIKAKAKAITDVAEALLTAFKAAITVALDATDVDAIAALDTLLTVFSTYRGPEICDRDSDAADANIYVDALNTVFRAAQFAWFDAAVDRADPVVAAAEHLNIALNMVLDAFFIADCKPYVAIFIASVGAAVAATKSVAVPALPALPSTSAPVHAASEALITALKARAKAFTDVEDAFRTALEEAIKVAFDALDDDGVDAAVALDAFITVFKAARDAILDPEFDILDAADVDAEVALDALIVAYIAGRIVDLDPAVDPVVIAAAKQLNNALIKVLHTEVDADFGPVVAAAVAAAKIAAAAE